MPEIIALCLILVGFLALMMSDYIDAVEFEIKMQNRLKAVRKEHSTHGAHDKNGNLICCNTFTSSHSANTIPLRSSFQ